MRWSKHAQWQKADAITAAKVIPRFGIQEQISSDNGNHFDNMVIKKKTQLLSIKQRLGCVYHLGLQGLGTGKQYPQEQISQNLLRNQNGLVDCASARIDEYENTDKSNKAPGPA